MEIKQAGEIMIPLDEYPHIPYWFTLRQAIAEMMKLEFHTRDGKPPPGELLVFNEKYQLLGIVRRTDILRGLEPEFLTSLLPHPRGRRDHRQADPDRPGISSNRLVKGIQEKAERPVSDVMDLIKATVKYQDHVIKVICEMMNSRRSILPVIKDAEVAGVVRSEEIFQEVAKLLLDEDE